jgi:hypothetical protein
VFSVKSSEKYTPQLGSSARRDYQSGEQWKKQKRREGVLRRLVHLTRWTRETCLARTESPSD